jgi:hypothetical protein
MLGTSHPNRRLARSKAAVCVALAASGPLACAGAHADGQEAAPASPAVAIDRFTPADLERAFWECDYFATTRGMGLEEGADCADIYDKIKRTKFGGDFHTLLAWWQRSKATEHAAIATHGRVARSDSHSSE